jgi:hypothetical protein
MSYKILRGRWCEIVVLNVRAPTGDKSYDDTIDSFCGNKNVYSINSLNSIYFLEDFNTKTGRKNIFKPTIWNETLHKMSNGNGVLPRVKSCQKYSDPHRNIHTFTWIFPDGKSHNQNDYILLDGTRHSSVLGGRLFGAADCDIDHQLVVAKVRERLAVSKKTKHRSHMEGYNIKKLNEIESKGQYRVEVSNRFAALENLDDDVVINRAWKAVRI